MRRHTLLALLVACFPPGSALAAPARGSVVVVGDSAFAAGIRRALDARRLDGMRWPDIRDVRARAESLYAEAGWQPLWLEGGLPTTAARKLVAVMSAAEARGLAPADYDVPALLDATVRPVPLAGGGAARFDLMLTLDALRFADALGNGRVAPAAAGADLQLPRTAPDVPGAVRALRTADDPDSVLGALEPASPQYQQLRRALLRYRSLAQDSGLVPLPALPRRLRPGDAYAGAAALRRLLAATGDLPDSLPGPAPGADTLYDATLVDAVRRLQRRSGFADDGIVGDSTASRLNRPFAQAIRQIELTLERWRWLPRTFESPPIVVNIPAFRLVATDSAEGRLAPALAMNVVVGRAFKTETPVFTAWMTYLVFSPYWEVPKSIELNEIRPAAMRGAGYLRRNRMELLRGGRVVPATPENVAAIGRAVHVRQLPGDDNSLGRVKFMLPNAYAVYLHDTPSKALFDRARRDFSHGCIRLQDPPALARFVLRDQPEWTEARMARAMQSDRPVNVTLSRRIPVLVLYGSTVVGPAGEVFFHGDVYGHDRRLDRLLAKGYPYAR
jgi:murein L,D-transpeptidase YcbB/YkuD